jgi:hypothetical protein
LIGEEQKVWSEHWDTSLWVDGSKMVLFEEQVPVLFVDDRAVMDMVWIEMVRKRNWRKYAMGLWRLVDVRQPKSLWEERKFVSATFTFQNLFLFSQSVAFITSIPSPTNFVFQNKQAKVCFLRRDLDTSQLQLAFAIHSQGGHHLNWLN